MHDDDVKLRREYESTHMNSYRRKTILLVLSIIFLCTALGIFIYMIS